MSLRRSSPWPLWLALVALTGAAWAWLLLAPSMIALVTVICVTPVAVLIWLADLTIRGGPAAVWARFFINLGTTRDISPCQPNLMLGRDLRRMRDRRIREHQIEEAEAEVHQESLRAEAVRLVRDGE